MELLQVTILCLLLSSLCSSENNTDVNSITTHVLPSATISPTKTSVLKPTTVSNPVMEATAAMSIGTTSKKLSSTSLQPTHSSLMATVKGEELTPSSDWICDFPTVNPLHPEASPSNTSTLPSISVTTPGNSSQFQGTEDAKNASSSSASPSYSSIILPVVIALIVVTLSAFVLVGLYRMCWKTDPGTPENGNDQPQSDKESVKLLTVKTISHESGEHSAQGKSKN
ncbi:endomucin [Leptonychotes weddellii]|uniref:Endomucin n=1 Tax=Leptonychotes weddellii TaxID=9713 RepID=A0A7F8QXT2_LEPWE|nr:endomucin [Leptonychotes weddellii]